jgi:hypothetical protein
MMASIPDIQHILIILEVADKQVLFIVLDEDGSINRKGNGSPDCEDNDLFIGITSENLFSQVKLFITEEMQEFWGNKYDLPDKKGRLCCLNILYKGEEIETGVQFLYGEFSQGPPNPFRTLVVKAVELTNNWHEQQKRIAFESKIAGKAKPWWKFW